MINGIKIFTEEVLKNKELTDEQLYDFLLEKNIAEPEAYDIVLFAPTAYNRMYFRNQGLDFPDSFMIIDNKNESAQKKLLSDNQIFQLAQKYYLDCLESHLSKDDVLKIVSRCSEFGVIVQAIENGSLFKNLIIEPMKLIYD